MKVESLGLPGVKLIKPEVFTDHRGFFMETFEKKRYETAEALHEAWQVNMSHSHHGVIRGMHFQLSPGQAKLIQVIKGRIYDVFVNIDPQSKHFGKWEGIYLDESKHEQLYIPKHYAHGFCVVSEYALVLYKVNSPYNAQAEKGFRFDDRDVGIKWPIVNPILSEKDKAAPYLRELQLL